MFKKKEFKSTLCMFLTFLIMFSYINISIVEFNQVHAENTKENNAEKSIKDEKFQYKEENNKEKTIKIVNKSSKIKVGETTNIEVKDDEENTIPTENLVFTISDEKLGRMDEKVSNKFMALGSGTIAIKAALKNNPNINDEVEFKVLENSENVPGTKAEEKVKVKVRVEGPEYTILPETEVQVKKGSQNKDVLKAAGLEVVESGGFVNAIEGVRGKSFWSFSPYAASYLKDEDIVINGNGAMGRTVLEGASTVNEGEEFEVICKSEDGKAISGAEIKYYKSSEYDYKSINKNKIKPIDTKVKTDSEGKAKIKLEKGKYFIVAEKSNISRTKALMVEVKEKAEEKVKVKVRVEGPEYTILPETEVQVKKGSQNKDVLKAAGLEVVESGGFVNAIEGVRGKSFWSFSPYAASYLKDEDIVINGNGAMGRTVLEGASTVNEGEEFEVICKSEDGKAISGAEIKYYKSSEYDYKSINKNKIKPIDTKVKTDSEGKAKIKLEKGKYFIVAEKSNTSRTKALMVEVKEKDAIEKLNIILPKETTNGFLCEIKVIDSEGKPVKDAEIAYGLYDTWLSNFDKHVKGKTDEFGKAIIKVENNNATCTMYFKARKGKVKSEIKTLKLLKEDYVIKTEEKDLLMGQGEKHIFKVIINGKNSDEIKEDFIWESLNREVATVDQNGQVTALKVGETIIKASIKKDPRYCIEIKVKVLKDVVKTMLRIELNSQKDYHSEIRLPGKEINLENLLKAPTYFGMDKESKYKPKFDENGKLTHIDNWKKGEPCFSVFVNGKFIERPKDLIIKTGDSIVCSQNGATKLLEVELPKECKSGTPIEVVAKDERGERVEGAWIKERYKDHGETDKEGKKTIILNEKDSHSIIAEKKGYVRAENKKINVFLPKLKWEFPKKVDNNKEFDINFTADEKVAPGVKIYHASQEIFYAHLLHEDRLIGITDDNGNIKGKLNLKEDKYYVYAVYNDNLVSLGFIDVSGKDNEKPEIIVEGIDNNLVVITRNITFNVLVKDNTDEVIIPEVKCNGSILTKDKDKYKASLKDGENTIEIIAKDKAGNSERKEYTLIYKSAIAVNKIVIKGSKEKLHPKDKITLKAAAVDKENNAILGKEIIFSSSNEKVAKVDSKTGEVIAIGNGTVTLTAILKDNVSIKESVDITVTDKYEVYIRIEGYNHTILPRTKLEVGVFDLNEHLGKASGSSAGESNGWDVSKFDKPTNAHAIVKALIDAGFRQKKAKDKDESKLFDFQDYGWSLYIAMIAGDREFDHKGSSGWLYRVNDKLPPVGCNGVPLNDGDEIVWMYSPYGFDNIYTKIFANSKEVGLNEEVNIKLDGYEGGYQQIKKLVQGATVLVNGKPYSKDGKIIKTDKFGNATLTFDKAGEYEISATRIDGKKLIDIIRPNPIKINVIDKKDDKKPNISLKGIMHGQTFDESEITFTVTAKNNKGEKITPIVKCNNELLTGKDDSYKAVLKEGENTLIIKAVDEDGNVVEKTIKIICDTQDKNLPEIKLKGIESGVTDKKEVLFTVEAIDKKDGKLEPIVKLNDKVISKENGKYKVILKDGLNTIYIEATNSSKNTVTEVIRLNYKKDKPVVEKNLDEAIDKVHDFIIKNSTYSSDWKSVAFNKSGLKLPENYNSEYLKNVAELLKDSKGYFYKVTDYERIALGVVSAGGDPRNIGGYNLLDKIYNFKDPNYPKRGLDFQGLNGVIYALVALDSREYEIPNGAKYTREYMLDYILKNRNSDGGWDLNMNGKNSDVDITSMTLIALAPHHDYVSKDGKKVKVAIEEAVKWLSNVQRKDGGFNSWNTENNSESCAQTIIGLCANGINPTSKEFTKDRNLVENLLRFQQPNGEFYHLMDGSEGVNGMATEQAYQALLAYKIFINSGSKYCYGKNSLYYFGKQNNEDAIEVTNLLPGESLKKGSSAEAKLSIKNNGKENKKITLAVVLYDSKTNEMINYSYIKKTLKAGAKEDFAGGFIIPKEGNFVVKAIICDDLSTEKMNVLADPILIKVE
ncbi:DUF4430 domain-containing protein [Clostridium rectalis]|uniref:DUF4430 domain-containing protein n=1 Tax=Clostridium rectalis TaxID=2040295 RepID=UPI000F63AD9D|nr:DUF4430 domain-containing protein [Clostridium rectalis]